MALIQCPKCGKEFSDRAQACPQCGFNLKRFMPIQLFLVVMGMVLLVFSIVGYFVKLYEINPVLPVIIRWCWRIYICTFWISRLFVAQSKERGLVIAGLTCYIIFIACGVVVNNYGHPISIHEWSLITLIYWGGNICYTLMCAIILVYSIFLSGIEKYFAIAMGILTLFTQVVFQYDYWIPGIRYFKGWLAGLYYQIYSDYDYDSDSAEKFIQLILPRFCHLLANICLIAFITSCNISSWKRKLFG